jgi:RNA-directed DNA polymerase
VLAHVRTDPVRSWLEPKPAGGYRRMAGLSGRDAAAWDAVAGRVAEVLEPRLDRRVLASRAVVHAGGWRPVDLGPSLRRARRRARQLTGAARFVVLTDVAAFYPSVTPVALHGTLRRMAPAEASLAAAMAESWASEGYAGLPIGPPGSAVLANAVLDPVDRALAGVPFLRWVDDYLIGAGSERAAFRILERIDEALAPLGLRRAEAKTAVLDGGEAQRWPGRASTGAIPKR